MRKITAKAALLRHLRREGDQQLLANIASGRVEIVDFEIVARAEITDLSGLKKIIQINTPQKIGTVNIDKGKLEDGQLLAIDKVRIAYATHATETDPAAIKAYSADTQGFDAGLRSGELFINQGGREKRRLQVANCGSSGDSDMATGRTDAAQLEAPFVLNDKEGIEVGFEFADGITLDDGANKQHAEVILYGMALNRKG